MSGAGIRVYIPDPAQGEKGGTDQFREELEKEYGLPFVFVSMSRGAAAAPSLGAHNDKRHRRGTALIRPAFGVPPSPTPWEQDRAQRSA
ncbi:MAG TPA: hypothetical protein VEH76_12940, partial [Methylocystis sp.]|nr:hypothetical protein [Methylocystis sp.]